MHRNSLFLPLSCVLAIATAPSLADTSLVAVAPPAALASDSQCAAPADAARVIALYSAVPAPMTYAAAAQLKLSEAAIASAIPADKAVGTSGAAFTSVWDSLSHWKSALFMIMKDGNIFEISSVVSSGTPSTKSKFFNLGHEGALSGHLRPDLIGSIYAMQLPAREGFTRGVLFYDVNGEGVLGVFAGSEGKEPTAEQLSQFKASWDLIAGLPRVCASGTSGR